MHFDDILKNHVGQLGRFQVYVVAILCIEQFFVPFATLNTAFTADTPDLRCDVPELANRNCTAEQLLQLTSPRQDEDRYDTCHVYVLNYSHVSAQADVCQSPQAALNHTLDGAPITTRDCNKWTYDKSRYKSTMVTEWDLVCDRAWLVSTANAVFMAGRATGNFIFGFLADRYGRRIIVLGATLMNIVCGLVCAFAPNIASALLARFLWANFATGKTNTNYVLVMEFSGPDWRMMTTNFYFSFWCVGYMALAGVAYFVRDWRLLVAITTAPELIFCALFYWYVPESPRWLLARHREEEARHVVERMARVNRSTMPVKLTTTEKEKTSTKTVLDLFRTPQIRLLTLNLCFTWFVEGFVYYGLSLNSAKIGGNPYVSFAIMGGIEIPAYATAALISKYYGRIVPFSGCLLLTGLALFVTILVPTEQEWLMVTLYVTGKFFISISFSLVWMYASEAYPTCVRNIGLTATAVAGRLASVLAAYVAMLAGVWGPLPLVVIGSLSVAAAGCVLLMPETKGVRLPQTLEDGEQFIRKNRFRFCRKRFGKTRKEEASPDDAADAVWLT